MSRVRLDFYNLEQRANQDLYLKIPICDVYGPIIERAFPSLDQIGWRHSTKGTCYTYIRSILPDEQAKLITFLDLLKKLLCITLTDHLAEHFNVELAEAYALDFNFKQDQQPLEYTKAGKAEHAAKEEHNPKAIKALAKRLATVIGQHPTLDGASIIAAVPARPSKKIHLPVQLVSEIGILLNRPTGLKLATIEHDKLKGLNLQDKIEVLSNAFTLGESVKGKTVLLIDDLYQSGATLWSLARFLIKKGAKETYGLACVKSWSDTDNV